MGVIYTDQGTNYPGLMQPQHEFVIQAEEEREGEEVTWPEIHKRAWELQKEDEEFSACVDHDLAEEARAGRPTQPD